MKYIDSEKLIAEIERRRKQRIEANEKIAKGEIFTDTEDEFNSSLARYGNRLVYQELFEIICFIETLQQELPEIPSNLDEAAENCTYCEHAYARESFKEGAEWMAGQGVTLECLIDYKSGALVGIDSVPIQEILKDYCNKIGASRVIVQIRKK